MKEDIKRIIQSKTVKGIFIGLGVALVVLVIFQTGTVVGYHRARFAGHLGDNYIRTFDDQGLRKKSMIMKGFPGEHGAMGEIISTVPPRFVVADHAGVEKTIVTDSETIIRKFRDTLTVDDLKSGNMVVVIGAPESNGQIKAKLIRILPPMPMEVHR